MRKLFTFLCAALMSVGMFAQSNVQAVEFSVPSEWQYDVDGFYTAADLPGFTATTQEQALELQEGISTTPGGILIYGFSGNQALYIWYNMFAIQVVSSDAKKISLAESVYDYGEVVYYTAAAPQPAEVTVVFAANNNTVERTVSLPHEFLCSYYNRNGELDAIIQELYGISGGRCCDYIYPVASGNEAVSAGSYGDDNYIAISAAFEGTATVSGRYWNWDAYDGDGDWMDYSLTISIKGDEPKPTTYTLQLVADPTKGSVALQDPSSDIIDNGNGNYTVPENAEVTILATPLEGYEFSGWKVGNIDEMVGCYYCGVALNTLDNPLTITMTEDIAYLAEFEAAQPQETVVTITEADYQGNNIFEKDGVTLTVARVDADSWYITGPGTFTNSLGKNFIKIEVTPVGGNAFIYGEGWEGDYQNKTWTGNAPTVSFNEDIQGQMEGFTATCTLEEPTGEEGIEKIVLTEKAKKVVVDGMIYIVRDGKMFDLTGVEVK